MGGTWVGRNMYDEVVHILVTHKLNMIQECDVATKEANVLLSTMSTSQEVIIVLQGDCNGGFWKPSPMWTDGLKK